MRIRKVSLQNFRTFKDFELNFEKDTTIIFAGSGKGKTTLKEAILMGLHANKVWNEVFDDVKKEADFSKLFTNGSIDELMVTTLSIKLELIDDEYEYFIEHNATISGNKINSKKLDVLSGKYNFFEMKASKRAISNPGDNPKLSVLDIERMFPLDLAKILFFSGEIERLSESRDLKTTLYKLFDLTKFENAKKALNNVKKDYEKDKQNTSSGNLQSCLLEIEKNSTDIERTEIRLESEQEKIKEEEVKLTRVEIKIKEQEDLKEYSLQRETFEFQQKIAIAELEREIVLQGRKLIEKDRNSMYALRKNLQNIFNVLNDDGIEKRFITGIHQEAIEQIINDNVCVCGTQLTEETIKYLLDIKDSLPPNEIGIFKSEINKYLNGMFENIDLDLYDDHIILIETIGRNIEEMSNKIKDNIYDRSIEVERNNLYQNIGIIKSNITQLERKIERLTFENIKLKDKEEKYIQENNKAILIDNKIKYVEQLISKCEHDYLENQKAVIEGIEIEFFKMLKEAEVEKEFRVGKIFDPKNLKLKIDSFSEGQKTMLNTFLMLSVLRVSLENNIKLPAILDGFISKQGIELTNKTMSVIKKQENQLILFTLDKDKQHVIMDETVADYYELKREVNDEFSRIEECRWN